MRDVRKAAERGMRITQRSGRSKCLRYEKQMRELKAAHREEKEHPARRKQLKWICGATERSEKSNREM
jgi:hypothetical protein